MNRFKQFKQSWSLGKYSAGLVLVAVVCACAGAKAYPARDNLVANISQSPDAAIVPTASTEIEALRSQVKKLEANQNAMSGGWIEHERKTIDWWLAFLAILTTVIAFGGGFIPWLMGKHKVDMLESIIAKTRTAADEAQKHEKRAKDNADAIEVLKLSVSGESKSEETIKAAESVATDNDADPIERRRAQAIRMESQDLSPAKLYYTWQQISNDEPADEVAAFNTAYWAHEMAEDKSGQDKLKLLQLAQSKYEQALSIKPDDHSAVYNWGIALAKEARTLASENNRPAAYAKWAQAGEKFVQALSIKPDDHSAVYNWGIALDDEAKNLASEKNLPAAYAKWAQAEEMFARALSIKPKMHEAVLNWSGALLRGGRILAEEQQFFAARAKRAQAKRILQTQVERGGASVVAYNLACVFALENNVDESIKWLNVSKDAGELPTKEHLDQDDDLNEIRVTPKFSAWFAALP